MAVSIIRIGHYHAKVQTKKHQDNLNEVLFVGNSHTYFHELPLVVSAMAKAKGKDLTCSMSVAGGATLEDHLNGRRKLNTIEMIKKEKYDAVILQDQSLRPIRQPNQTIRDIGRLCEPIRKSGAAPYLFVTWDRETSPLLTQKYTTRTYVQAARENSAKVVPVGIAWHNARKQKPDISLYDEDGCHASQLGAYLSACVFFAVLTNESPKGLPSEIKTTNESGETVILLRVSEQNAIFCQQVAEQTIKEFASKQKSRQETSSPSSFDGYAGPRNW
jgi:hypothetical protein